MADLPVPKENPNTGAPTVVNNYEQEAERHRNTLNQLMELRTKYNDLLERHERGIALLLQAVLSFSESANFSEPTMATPGVPEPISQRDQQQVENQLSSSHGFHEWENFVDPSCDVVESTFEMPVITEKTTVDPGPQRIFLPFPKVEQEYAICSRTSTPCLDEYNLPATMLQSLASSAATWPSSSHPITSLAPGTSGFPSHVADTRLPFLVSSATAWPSFSHPISSAVSGTSGCPSHVADTRLPSLISSATAWPSSSHPITSPAPGTSGCASSVADTRLPSLVSSATAWPSFPHPMSSAVPGTSDCPSPVKNKSHFKRTTHGRIRHHSAEVRSVCQSRVEEPGLQSQVSSATARPSSSRPMSSPSPGKSDCPSRVKSNSSFKRTTRPSRHCLSERPWSNLYQAWQQDSAICLQILQPNRIVHPNGELVVAPYNPPNPEDTDYDSWVELKDDPRPGDGRLVCENCLRSDSISEYHCTHWDGAYQIPPSRRIELRGPDGA